LKSCPSDLTFFAEEVSPRNSPNSPNENISSGLHLLPGKQRRDDAAGRVPTSLLETYVKEWLGDAEYNGQSKRTIEGKRETLEKLLWFLKRENLNQCGRFEIKRFLLHVKNGHLEPLGRWDGNTPRHRLPISNRAGQLHFLHIRTYLKWLFEEELANCNPLDGQKQPKGNRVEVKPFTIDEIAMLLNAVSRGLNRARNEAIIYFLLDTGVRVSELCGLHVSEIDLGRRCATVTGKGNKTRDVWFGPDTARVIKKYLTKHPREDGDKLFYSSRSADDDGITPTGIQHTLKRLGEFAGLKSVRVSPHTFRHTFATEFIRSGGSPKALQMLLGHEDMQMTYRYVTLAEADAAEQHRQHSPARLLRGTKKK
jgi:site-specific recombinase XerD